MISEMASVARKYMSGAFYASKTSALTGPMMNHGDLFADLNNEQYQDNAYEALHRFIWFMNIPSSIISIRIISVLLSLIIVIASGCSDGADSREGDSASICTPGEVLLSETPPAPEAVCSIPPGPISSNIETTASQQQSVADQRRAELMDPSKITVVTCGTGSPFPSARAQSCLATGPRIPWRV